MRRTYMRVWDKDRRMYLFKACGWLCRECGEFREG